MQRADDAGSIRAPVASPGNAHDLSTSRRGILAGAMLAIPLAAVPASAAIRTPSPVMIAIAANRAAEERYTDMSRLEFVDPAAHRREEDAMLAAWDRLRSTEPESMADLVAWLDVITEGGTCGIMESDAPLLLARLRRLSA